MRRLIFFAAIVMSLVTSMPMLHGEAWPVERQWTSSEEQAFSNWIETVGTQARRSVNHLICDAQRNPLYDESDRQLSLYADCADLPVILRAYYAYKRRLPFIVTQVNGGRYTLRGNETAAVFDNLSFGGSAKDFLQMIPGVLHSGCYRTEPEASDSMTYPIKITPETLRPGIVFYSPEGHAGIVTEVTEDGEIYLLDGHPDQTVTRIRFSPKLTWKSTSQVGGFKAFRTVHASNGKVVMENNNGKLTAYSNEQYLLHSYYQEIRGRLTRRKVDPLQALEKTIREDIYAEVLDRVRSVDLGWAAGREREILMPPNLYFTVGDWENFSTPSRDLRLRRSFLQLPEDVRTYLRMCRESPERLAQNVTTNPSRLGRDLLARKETLFHHLKFNYRNSLGQPVTLSLADVEKRLFLLSFDPNHPPELRWGASGAELASARHLASRYFAGYTQQQPWRNRLEKKHGAMTVTDSDNPLEPPPHDISSLIKAIIP